MLQTQDDAKATGDAVPKKTYHVYGHGVLDYKYKKVFEPIGVQFHSVNLWGWFRSVWRMSNRDRDKVFHIRYLLWRGYLGTVPMYAALALTCRLKRIPIMWTCHNVHSHGMPSPRCNAFLRWFVSWVSSAVIVLHKDLRNHLPHPEKVHVACFGDFSEFQKSQTKQNQDFADRYAEWLSERNIDGPDVIFIGEYSPKKRIETLLDFLRSRPDLNGLIVCPKLPEELAQTPGNLFVFSESVTKELDAILDESQAIGFVAHDNLSLPTAINLYGSYGIPSIVYDVPPINTIARENGVGLVFSDETELAEGIDRIRRDYGKFSQASRDFLTTHSWAESQRVHLNVIESISN